MLKLIVLFIIFIIIKNCTSISESDYARCLISNVTEVFDNGSIRTNTSEVFNKFQYIQTIGEKLEYYNKQCLCNNRFCVRKCCSNDQILIPNDSCYKPDNKNFPKLVLEFYNITKKVNNDLVNDSLIRFIEGSPCVYGKYRLWPENGDLYYLQYNKELLYTPLAESSGMLNTFTEEVPEEFHTLNDYCIENDLLSDLNFYLCISYAVQDTREQAVILPLTIGMIISIPFLFLTFAVYAIIPELQNLHGKSLMCYVFTLMFAYTLLAFIQLDPTQPDPWCEIIAYSIYYLFLVSFFWLNVMCFDIWWTFSGIGGFKSSFRNAEQKKFLFYNLYAWGVPTTIVMFSALVQYHPSVPEAWNKPRLGKGGTCWFQDKHATLLYFHFPLFFVITCNVVLFVTTAIKIIKIKRDTAMLKTKDSQRHESSNYTKDKQRFALYLKLFVVMGVNWTMELISMIFETNDTQTSYAWLLTDLGNTLHGVLIFIIFVCKRQIWALLVKRYHVMMGRPYQANVAFSRTQTTSYSVSQSTDTNVSQHGSVKLNSFN